MSHETLHLADHLKKRSALFMGAVLIGGLVEVGRTVVANKQPTIADIKSYCEDEGPSFIFFRGCGENYQAQAPLHHRKLKGYGSLHFEYQIQGRHSQDVIDQNVIKACKLDGDRDRVLIGTSMGLMNAMRSLRNPVVREAIGEGRLAAIISRSGITSGADLQPGMQKAANASARTPSLAVVGDLWQAHRLHQAHKDIPHSTSTSDDEALLHHESSAYMPFPLVSSQHREIYESQPWQAGSHADVAMENPGMRLFHISAEYDAVANREATVASLKSSFGIPVEEVIDGRRRYGSHADDLEFIEPLADVMSQLSRRHRHMLAAVYSSYTTAAVLRICSSLVTLFTTEALLYYLVAMCLWYQTNSVTSHVW